jgi:hypothetical protein
VSSSPALMTRAVSLDTAGAGLRSAHTPPLQSPLAHCRLSLHGSLSARLWEVGVAVGVLVGVAVGVGVPVGVAVLVGVAVGCTHVPIHTNPAAPASLPPSQTRAWQPLVLPTSQTRLGSQLRPSSMQHGSPRSPQPLEELARPAASRSTTITTSPIRVIAAVYPKRRRRSNSPDRGSRLARHDDVQLAEGVVGRQSDCVTRTTTPQPGACGCGRRHGSGVKEETS